MATHPRLTLLMRPLAAALLCTSAMAFADCDSDAGRLESSEGRVHVELNGDWQPLAIGACVPAGTRVRISEGRAVFRLANETLLRASGSTLLQIAPPAERHWIHLFDGMLHFITRTPRAFEVETDYVNAGVKGTEFVIAANHAQQNGEIVMFEGEVLASNAHGQQAVSGGQQVIAHANEAPRLLTVPTTRDAVQWTLYAPPLPLSTTPLQPEHPHVLAQQAIAALVTGATQRADELVARAQTLAPDDAVVLVTRSYLQQAHFDLKGALHSARAAAEIDRDNPATLSRLAEIALINGDTDAAQSAATQALQRHPDFARAHTINGFIRMQQLDFDAAEAAFARALAQDASDPLARLGAGLIDIRRNRVEAGRQQLELAVALDPGQSLLRSYLGKAYQEEHRDRLATDQYTLAKNFDAADPTPWLYSALLAQAHNRPFEALDDINRSIALNDNRAVYRSLLQLDSDDAVRSAGQAQIYRKLGFDALAQRTAARAVSNAPGEYGGHRQLAEAYADDPRYDAARASEVLQAQLRQPLSASPILPMLGETSLMAIEGAGPGALGYREYNAMFVREKPWVSVSGIGGSNNTGAGEIAISGVSDRVAYAVGQYHYESLGHRANNDARYDIVNAYAKVQATEDLSMLLSASRREEDSGNIGNTLLDDAGRPVASYQSRRNAALIGATYSLTPDIELLGVLQYSEGDARQEKFIADPPVSLVLGQETLSRTTNGELQARFALPRSHLIAGIDWAETDISAIESQELAIEGVPPEFWPQIPASKANATERYHAGYAYWNIAPTESLTINAGIAPASLDSDIYRRKISGWYPKIATTWQATARIDIRGTWFKSLKRPAASEQTLEPTTIGDFNQFDDEISAVESENYGVGLDFDLSEHRIGMETLRKLSDIPVKQNSATSMLNAVADISNVYWYWDHRPWTLSMSYRHEKAEFSDFFPTTTPTPLTTQSVPMQIKWFSGDIFLLAAGTHIHQKGKFSRESISSSFSVIDAGIGYSLWDRKIELELRCNNVFDKSFRYEDTNLYDSTSRVSPLMPERVFIAKIRAAF